MTEQERKLIERYLELKKQQRISIDLHNYDAAEYRDFEISGMAQAYRILTGKDMYLLLEDYPHIEEESP